MFHNKKWERCRTGGKGMRSIRKTIASLLSLCLVFALAGCGEKNGDTTGNDNELRIAYIGPITGEAAAWGTPEKNTLEMLVEEINAAGGIAGYNVVLDTYDNRNDNVETSNAAKKAIEVG